MKKTAILFSICVPTITWAYDCSGIVKGTSIEATTGDVFVSSIGDTLSWPRLCNVQTAMNGISINACKLVYSTLLAAQVQQRTVTIYIDNANTCTTNQPWQVVTGFYHLTIN